MTHQLHDQVLSDALERLQAQHGHFEMHLGFAEVITLISQVQLALRHPANTGYSSRRARGIVDAIIGKLEEQEPLIGPLLRMGDDPGHDGKV